MILAHSLIIQKKKNDTYPYLKFDGKSYIRVSQAKDTQKIGKYIVDSKVKKM